MTVNSILYSLTSNYFKDLSGNRQMRKCIMKPKTHLWISKLILRVSYFKMILLILYICVFSIIGAGKPLRWTPKCSSYEKWPKSQVFIFHTKNPLNFDYPDCFEILLTPSLVLTIASCFKECVYCKGFFWDLLNENTVSIVKVTTLILGCQHNFTNYQY